MLQIIGVPIDSVGRAGGTEHSPRVLRELGLADRLDNQGSSGIEDVGDLDIRIRGEERDAVTGVVGWPDVARMTDVVADAVSASLAAGRTPVLLGGCCSLEPAAVAGTRRALGSVGLVHVDGHLDVYNGLTSPTGEAADMPNSVLLGLGPDDWISRLGSGPMLQGSDIVVLGHRDPDELIDGSLDVAKQQGIGRFTAEEVRIDPFAAGESAGRALEEPTWVHLDVDVLDQDEFPATDYLLPGGLTMDQLHASLQGAFSAGRVIGFSVGCYNPDKDADRSCGQRLVEMMVDVLGR